MNRESVTPVVLDTNFLLLPVTHKVRIFDRLIHMIPEPHRMITFSCVVEELKALSEKDHGKKGAAAGTAIKLLHAHKIQVEEAAHPVDEALIKYASAHPGCIICTNDRALKKRLREAKAYVISLRGRDTLVRI
ncbi:Ribonuclease VapC9 [uncultured archaeon]|nr:Ribonuclease VapC9 [uncultured archaeon]